jgi:hypothetical protein
LKKIFFLVTITKFYILVTVLLGIIPANNQLDAQFLLYIFISILYMFRVTLCSSSGEPIVSIQHLVYVTLCRWLFGMKFLHTQVCSKHVENRNKYIHIYKRNCVSSLLFIGIVTITFFARVINRLLYNYHFPFFEVTDMYF